jgi:hypothetical protein
MSEFVSIDNLSVWLGDFVIEFLNSPSWCVPLQEFIDDNCVIFDSEEVA